MVVRGNRDHLRQVINNLLDNAVKFTPAGGTVTVGLRRGGGVATLTVADTGPGIAADDLPHVFDRFFRGDRSRRRDGRGTGLGLSICRAVVAAHGGEITAASRPGEGASFTVTFLAAGPAPVPVAAARPGRPTG